MPDMLSGQSDNPSFKLLDSVPEAIIVSAANGTILFLNKASRRLFGVDPGEGLGKSIQSLIAGDPDFVLTGNISHFLNCRADADKPGREITAIRSDGSSFPALMLSEEAKIDDQFHFIISVRDLSQRKLQEEKSVLLENRLGTAQRIARLGNWDWHIPSGDLWWSDEIYTIFGYEKREFGATYEAFLGAVHAEDRELVESAVAKAIANHGLYSIRHRIIRPDGNIRIVQEQGEVEYDDANEPLAMHGTVQDITEQVVTEQQLHKALRLESVGRLTGGIAHDFNNLLGIVIGNLGILRMNLIAENELKLLDTALNAAERGSGLVRRLLTFSKAQSLNTSKVDIRQLAQDIKDLISRTLPSSVSIEFEIPEQASYCDIDASQLESAILNLTINARDAMPNGGQIKYRVTQEKFAIETYLGGAKIAPGSYVSIAVEDNGTGIPEEILERILEPFFSTKTADKGTGLGLSMVYGFVEQSGGYLCINSEPGTGTVIRLLFPESA